MVKLFMSQSIAVQIKASGQLHVPAAFPRGRDFLYHVDRRLCGPQSRSRRGGASNGTPALHSITN